MTELNNQDALPMTTAICYRRGRPRALDDPEVRRRIIAMVRAGL